MAPTDIEERVRELERNMLSACRDIADLQRARTDFETAYTLHFRRCERRFRELYRKTGAAQKFEISMKAVGAFAIGFVTIAGTLSGIILAIHHFWGG